MQDSGTTIEGGLVLDGSPYLQDIPLPYVSRHIENVSFSIPGTGRTLAPQGAFGNGQECCQGLASWLDLPSIFRRPSLYSCFSDAAQRLRSACSRSRVAPNSCRALFACCWATSISAGGFAP